MIGARFREKLLNLSFVYNKIFKKDIFHDFFSIIFFNLQSLLLFVIFSLLFIFYKGRCNFFQSLCRPSRIVPKNHGGKNICFSKNLKISMRSLVNWKQSKMSYSALIIIISIFELV